MSLGVIGFTAPWLLVAFAALPILWFLLRAVPPAPVRRRFPGVVLLLGLEDSDSVSDRTPWWLLLLRMLVAAAVILGLAGPVLNPPQDGAARPSGPLLIVIDGSWASARDWDAQIDVIDGILAEAGQNGRRVAVLVLIDPEPPVFQSAENWRSRLPGLKPFPWDQIPDSAEMGLDRIEEERFETRWFSDGLAHPGRDAFLKALRERGPVTVHESPRPILALRPPVLVDDAIDLTALRAGAGLSAGIVVEAHGLDPSGESRIMASIPMEFAGGDTEANGTLLLPAELRMRLTRFTIKGESQAGAVSLSDDGLKRREVALISGREDREGLELLSPLHFLRQALAPTAEILQGALMEVLPANPDVIALADVAVLSEAEEKALLDWVDSGGVLLRFAGPRVAASDVSRSAEEPLMPIRLRAGGRTVGGAMSWGEPKALAPFPEGSPFQGLTIPADVLVRSQVLAQPDPTLSDRVIAQLIDGTPLVTRKSLGSGQVVLFHVTANAEWSTLPLSGLFVQMLERLTMSSSITLPDAAELAGTTWQPVSVLDGFGRFQDPATLPGVPGEELLDAPLGPTLMPGLYDGPERRVARNVIAAGTVLEPVTWPADVPVKGLEPAVSLPFGGWLLALALVLLTVDIFATLALSGRLWSTRAAAGVMIVLGVAFAMPRESLAQSQSREIAATSEVVLAYVITGNKEQDATSRAGLEGLGNMLTYRTSVEPAQPMGVNLETDELAFYPLLYWPITPDQVAPSPDAYARLNEYLRNGGQILFDTRDADLVGLGASSPNGAALQRLAAPLDIPPLEQVPKDHVLTRSFYLLTDFPGRYMGRPVWVEAAPPDAERIEGMPFRNLNDGVTPVVIGGNDWATAWAVTESGGPMFPVGRGFAGERQREFAYRFGINLVMHVLSGNYKSDQVHVPALLERLGQ